MEEETIKRYMIRGERKNSKDFYYLMRLNNKDEFDFQMGAYPYFNIQSDNLLTIAKEYEKALLVPIQMIRELKNLKIVCYEMPKYTPAFDCRIQQNGKRYYKELEDCSEYENMLSTEELKELEEYRNYIKGKLDCFIQI